MSDFDFEKNNSIKDVSTVPEKYRNLYTEGKDDAGETIYALSDAARPLVADYVGVSKTLAGVRQDKKKVTDENAERRIATKAVEELATTLGLEAGDEGTAAVLKEFISSLQGKVKGGEELKINLDKINGDWQRRLDEALSNKDNDIVELNGALSKHLVSDSASRALADYKGSIDLLLPHVQSQCKVVRNDDGTYSVRVLDSQGDFRSDGAGGWLGVKALVEEMKGQDKFARAFESESPGGTGTPPGAMNRNVQPSGNREMTSVEKIREGLKKGQFSDGRGKGSSFNR